MAASVGEGLFVELVKNSFVAKRVPEKTFLSLAEAVGAILVNDVVAELKNLIIEFISILSLVTVAKVVNNSLQALLVFSIGRRLLKSLIL